MKSKVNIKIDLTRKDFEKRISKPLIPKVMKEIVMNNITTRELLEVMNKKN